MNQHLGQQQAQQKPLHTPVMLQDCMKQLNIQPQGRYIDATAGRGGHSDAILAQLGDGGHLLALDRDMDAINYLTTHWHNESRVALQHSPFSALQTMALQMHAAEDHEPWDGILFDLGVSSPQLDEAERGFSFMRPGPLDMRMDQRQPVTAEAWLATASESHIKEVLYAGGEPYATKIARAIVQERQKSAIKDTDSLVKVILSAVPSLTAHHHPATRTFQAIRMLINAEMTEISKAMWSVNDLLKPGGRVVVLSYHSTEHDVVKKALRRDADAITGLLEHERSFQINNEAEAVWRPSAANSHLKRVGHALRGTREEVFHNPRARSALLRTWEKKS